MLNIASLNDAVDAITAILDTVDRGNPDAMFDALGEIELLSVDTITTHGVRKLLGQDLWPKLLQITIIGDGEYELLIS